jgi:hypothetical protein
LGEEFLLQELRRVYITLVLYGHSHAGYGRKAVHFDPVGNSFEDIVFGRKRICSLVKIGFYLLITRISGVRMSLRTKITGRVNVAITGGLYNEENRDLIIIHV